MSHGANLTVGVIGLGYVGLPLAVAFAEIGDDVIALDNDVRKVAAIHRGNSYVEDISDERLREVLPSIDATTRYAKLARADAVIICVPTPLTRNREPELGPLYAAAHGLRDVLQVGQLVVLESTTFPGTTRDHLVPILEESGLKLGTDFNAAFSPERVDPGRTDFTLRNTPKVIGGVTEECTARASALYARVCDNRIIVSTPEAAELTKLLENIFRSVNIALVNELAILADKMGINIWEVIEAAATKPYGFMRFEPGPGMGGHCWTPGTLVMTENGPRAIETIKVGTLVLSGDGRLHPVLRTFQHDHSGEMVTVKVRGMPAVTSTAEHGMYAARDGRPPKNGRLHHPVAGKSTAELLGEIRKVQAADLVAKSDYMMWPHAVEDATINAPDHVTDEYVELAGWYLSEGNLVLTRGLNDSIRAGRVQISLDADHEDDIDRVGYLLPTVATQAGSRSLQTKLGIQDRRPASRCVVLRHGSLDLSMHLLADFGQHAETKRIPPWILWGDLNRASLLLRGMFRGDGHMEKDGRLTYATISPDLAYGTVMLLDRLSVPSTMTIAPAKPGHRLAYYIRTYGELVSEIMDKDVIADPSTQYPDRGDGNIYRRIEDTETSQYDGPVYNLHVDETNNYVVSAGVVSNCLPVDPFYLAWRAREFDMPTEFIELAGKVNQQMPERCVERIERVLNEAGKPIKDTRISVFGVAYKAATGDVREARR